MGRFMVVPSIFTPSTAKCRTRRSGLMRSTIWLPFVAFWALTVMSMPCWATSMSFGNPCLVVSRTILPTARPTAISLSIRPFTDLKVRLSFRFGPRKCTKSQNTGSLLTGPIKKEWRVRLTARNLPLGWIGSRNWWSCRISLVMLRNLLIRLRRAIWLRKSMSSHRMEQCVLCLRTQDPLILPMRSILRLGRRRQEPRLMAAWCRSIPSWRLGIRWKSSPMPIPLDRAVTGSISSRPARPEIKSVNSLKIKTRSCLFLKGGSFYRLNFRRMVM